MQLLINLRQPIERGFFCYDLSIYHPYHGSTVTALVNNLVSYGAPLLIILVSYWCNVAGPSTPRPLERKAEYVQEKRTFPWREITFFLFGVFTIQVEVSSFYFCQALVPVP